jgi:predicted phage terminase large subunit-like protein
MSELERQWAAQSPAHFATLASRGKWVLARHLDLANRAFLNVVDHKISRLLIAMPPRHGKSEFYSGYCPAWYTSRFPDNRVILASYAAEFAATWGRRARGLVSEFGPSLFDVDLKQDSKAADAWEIAGHRGGMQTCGVGGPLTGKGADLLIIDDPVKNAEEANSEVIREKTWEWYKSTAYTRLEPGGAVILIQTRWHEDDLAGRILAHAKETGEEWVIINLPALAEANDPLGRSEGEPLWKARYDSPDLERTKKTIGSYWFSALYQQRPVPPEGGMFKKAWFRYYTMDQDFYWLERGGGIVKRESCRRFGTMDLAFTIKKTADYTVLIAWAVTPRAQLLMLDMFRDRGDAPEFFTRVMDTMFSTHRLDYIGVEKVMGASLVTHGIRMAGKAIRLLVADTDKITRSIPIQVMMENGQVYIPKDHPERETIEHELMSFPFGAHDDIVDCFSYAGADLQRFGPPGRSEGSIEAQEQAEAFLELEAAKAQEQEFLSNPLDDRWYQ